MDDIGVTEVDGVIPERETFNEWLQRKGINFSPTGSPKSTVGGSGDGSSYTSPIIVTMEMLENNSPATQNLVPGKTWIKVPGIDVPMLYTPKAWRDKQMNNTQQPSGGAPVANAPPQG